MDRCATPPRTRWPLALLLVACGSPIRGDSALGDTPIVLAMRAGVVTDGPAAEGLLPPPPDRWRAEILPGDEVQVEALVASADGELDLDAHDALWFLDSSGRCELTAGEALEADDCSDTDSPAAPCRIGRGASPTFIAPREFDSAFYGRTMPSVLGVCMIVGLDRPTDECARRLGDGGAGLRPSDCALGSIGVRYGPLARWLERGGELPPWIDPARVPPLHSLELVRPDAGPGLGQVTLTIDWPAQEDDAEPVEVAEGDTLVVPVHARVHLDRTNDPRDEQLYLHGDEGYVVADRERVFGLGWYVGHPEAFVRGDVLWAPPQPGTFLVWGVVRDGNGNLGWGRFTLEVVP